MPSTSSRRSNPRIGPRTLAALLPPAMGPTTMELVADALANGRRRSVAAAPRRPRARAAVRKPSKGYKVKAVRTPLTARLPARTKPKTKRAKAKKARTTTGCSVCGG